MFYRPSQPVKVTNNCLVDDVILSENRLFINEVVINHKAGQVHIRFENQNVIQPDLVGEVVKAYWLELRALTRQSLNDVFVN